MTANYRGIEFSIVRKCTNNITISLYVDENVTFVTAPFTISDTELKNLLSANAATIKEARQRLNENADELIEYFSDYYIDVLGEQYDLELNYSGNTNCFENEKRRINIRIKAGATAAEAARYIKRKYAEFLHQKTDAIINDALKILNKDIKKTEYSWNIKDWVDYDIEKEKLYINPQITTKASYFLKFAILDSIMKKERFSDDAYKRTMEINIRGWKSIRRWCAEHSPDESVKRKTKDSIVLINKAHFEKIKAAVSNDNPDYAISVRSIINLRCDKESECGILSCFSFDAIVLCEHDKNPPKWYNVPCETNRYGFSTGTVSLYLPRISKYDDNYFPEEFIPPITEEEYENIANEVLEKCSPVPLEDTVPVPIRKIAEASGLKVIEFEGLGEKLNTSCVTVWDDCSIADKEGNTVIVSAKKGEIYVEQNASQEEINSLIACSYYNWKLHKSAFSYLYTNTQSNGSVNKCIFNPIDRDFGESFEQMSAYERAFSMSFCMAAATMVPSGDLDDMLSPIIKKIEKEGIKYISLDALINLLSKHYRTGRAEIKRRLHAKKILLESSEHAEMRKSVLYDRIVSEIKNSEQPSSEIKNMNDSFSATLNKLIKLKRKSVKRTRPDTQNGGADIAGASGISDHTLSRMRNKNGMEVSLQMILGVCCGLNLSAPETEMLLDKSPFKLQPSIREHYVYKLVMPLFKCYEIEEINDILEKAKVRKIGSDKMAR